MFKRASHVVAVALCALTAAGAHHAASAAAPARQRAAPGVMALSLQDALSRAVERSEEVQLARANVEIAEREIVNARADALPQFDADLWYTNTLESSFEAALDGDGPGGFPVEALGIGQEHVYSASVAASQLLYSGGRVSASVRSARLGLEEAQLQLIEELADTELQVRRAYFRALLAQELENSAEAALRQAASFLDQERQRQDAGYASELDVLRAEVSLANLQPQLVEARNASQLTNLNLKRLANLPLENALELTTPLAPTDADLAAGDVSPEELFESRAAIRAATRRVQIREEAVRIARAAYFPTISLQASYGSQLYPQDAFEFEDVEWRPDWTATLALRVPIFAGFRRSAQTAQARAQLRRAQLQLAQLRENVQVEYEQALGERARARATIEARERTIQQAQRVYDLTVLRYEQGQATQLEISDARLELLDARTNLAQALTDFYIADAQVNRALAGARPSAAAMPEAR